MDARRIGRSPTGVCGTALGHPALSGFEFDTGLFSKKSEGGPVNRKQLSAFPRLGSKVRQALPEEHNVGVDLLAVQQTRTTLRPVGRLDLDRQLRDRRRVVGGLLSGEREARMIPLDHGGAAAEQAFGGPLDVSLDEIDALQMEFSGYLDDGRDGDTVDRSGSGRMFDKTVADSVATAEKCQRPGEVPDAIGVDNHLPRSDLRGQEGEVPDAIGVDNHLPRSDLRGQVSPQT